MRRVAVRRAQRELYFDSSIKFRDGSMLLPIKVSIVGDAEDSSQLDDTFNSHSL